MSKEYTPLKQGDEIDYEVSLCQAAQLMDIASILAVDNKDVETIMKLADMWMKLGFSLCGNEEQQENPVSFGFGPTGGQFEIAEVGETEIGFDED